MKGSDAEPSIQCRYYPPFDRALVTSTAYGQTDCRATDTRAVVDHNGPNRIMA